MRHRFRIGTEVTEMSRPRSPWYEIAARRGRLELLVLDQETGFTGYLMRALEPGAISAVIVVSRPSELSAIQVSWPARFRRLEASQWTV